jgi:hypothetical protein
MYDTSFRSSEIVPRCQALTILASLLKVDRDVHAWLDVQRTAELFLNCRLVRQMSYGWMLHEEYLSDPRWANALGILELKQSLGD